MDINIHDLKPNDIIPTKTAKLKINIKMFIIIYTIALILAGGIFAGGYYLYTTDAILKTTLVILTAILGLIIFGLLLFLAYYIMLILKSKKDLESAICNGIIIKAELISFHAINSTTMGATLFSKKKQTEIYSFTFRFEHNNRNIEMVSTYNFTKNDFDKIVDNNHEFNIVYVANNNTAYLIK